MRLINIFSNEAKSESDISRPLDPVAWTTARDIDGQCIGTWDINVPLELPRWPAKATPWEVISALRDQHGLAEPAVEEEHGQKDDTVRLSVRGGTWPELKATEDARSGFVALTEQWRPRAKHVDGGQHAETGRPWYELASYEPILKPENVNVSHPARVLRAMQTDDSVAPKSRHAPTLSRFLLRAKDTNVNRSDVLVNIICRVAVPEKDAKKLEGTNLLFLTTKQFVTDLEQLDTLYLPLRARTNWIQVFILQIHHTSLTNFARFLRSLVPRHTDSIVREDPRWAELRQWLFVEIAENSYRYEELSKMGHELTATVKSMIDVVKATLLGNESAMASFASVEAELLGCCREIDGILENLVKGLQHHLKFLDLSRSLKQTRGLQHLTLLATIFLPMSLAASMLSMQTRFTDLKILLWDFFGVVFILGALASLLLTGISRYTKFREKDGRLLRDEDYRKRVRPKFVVYLKSLLLLYGLLVLTSFICGMYVNLTAGAMVLGTSTSAYVFTASAIFSLWLIRGLVISGKNPSKATAAAQAQAQPARGPQEDPARPAQGPQVDPNAVERADAHRGLTQWTRGILARTGRCLNRTASRACSDATPGSAV